MSAATPVKKYAYIDTLRGLAILAVVAVHASQVVTPSTPMLAALMKQGALGVQLFFVASALTLCMSFDSRRTSEAFPFRSFFIRRFFRIAPMFWLAAGFYTWFNGTEPSYWSPNGIDWRFVPLTLLFLHGFHPETINSVVPGGWSIAVEMWFYLVLPLILLRLFSLRRTIALLLVSVLVAHLSARIWPLIFPSPPNPRYLVFAFTDYNFLSQFPVFVLGLLLFQVQKLDWSSRKLAIVGFGSLLLTLALCMVGYWRIPHHIAAGGLFASFALLLSRFPTPWLVNRVTEWIGTLSFSIYLVHFAVLSMLKHSGLPERLGGGDLESLGFFALVMLGSSLLSWLTYQWIERPGIRLGARLIAKLDESAAGR